MFALSALFYGCTLTLYTVMKHTNECNDNSLSRPVDIYGNTFSLTSLN